MGPRLNSRGDADASGRALSSSSTASMGPRLNSRGDDFESCVETTLEFVLQWGRDLIVAETDQSTEERVATVEASMGPRLNSRGDDGKRGAGALGLFRASMGPRLNSRGDG